MKIFKSFSGILIFGAIILHLLLTIILFNSVLMYVEKSYKQQFIDNVRTTTNILANQSSHYLSKNRETIESFLDELLISGNITYVEIVLEDGKTYLPKEVSNTEQAFKEDFYFSEHNDSTYFISVPIDDYTFDISGTFKIGFDEALVQESIDTAYSRGMLLAAGYFILVIILILIFVPRLTASLRALKVAAQNVASGNNEESLKIDTRIEEFSSLMDSLEKMRIALLAKNRQVEKKEMYIRKIMNTMADAMVVMNQDLIIQSMNSAAEKIFGHKSSEIKDKPFSTLLAPCGPGKSCHNCKTLELKVESTNQTEHEAQECLGRRKNGMTFPIALYYSNFDYDNEHTIICNAHDMTEQKRAENKLTQALSSAEEANKSKSVFLSSMSHELRTPLNAIIGYSEILLEDAIDNNDEATSNDLRKIANAGKHLLALINNVLDLSKIEAGKMEVDNHEFALQQVIEDVIFTTQPLMEKTNNTFTLNFIDTNLHLFADFTKLKQALINLLGNAAKFTENGNISLNIEKTTVDDKPHIKMEVVDTGIGIAEEDIDKLFKEFAQANTQVMTKYGGSGLGLIISQKFCQLMGGDITVKSELGKGSTFTIILPITSPPAEQ